MLALALAFLLSCGHDIELSGEQDAVSSTFEAKLNQQIADIPKNVERARAVYDNLRPHLERYKGGMPSGFLAAIANFESGGKMSSRGDAALGEVGIFQITQSFPAKVGLPAKSRFDEETNIFLGGIEYQIMAVEMYLANPRIALGTPDSWKLARLAFAVGPGGTKKLMKLSSARSWSDLVSYVDAEGGVPLGRQSAGKVWFRVHVIDVLWDIGMKVKPVLLTRSPVLIPNSPAGAYKVPDHVAPYIPPAWRGPVLVAGTAGLLFAVSKIL